MSQVFIKSGSYRGTSVTNVKFTLVKGLQTGKKGNYVTVRNEGQFPEFSGIDTIKIKVDGTNDFEYIGGNVLAVEPEVDTETDEEAMNRIATRFEILDEMSKACVDGKVRAVVVTGPPGVGKSHGVSEQLQKATLFDNLKGMGNRYEIVKGTVSAIGLFQLLFKYKEPNNVLVFDDCDVWEDQETINMLKGALDSSKSRRISYYKDSRILREEGIPNAFDYRGSIIFITNKNFDSNRASKIQPHLDAFLSRSHFIDLTIDTVRDKMLRVKQVHRDSDGGLFLDYRFRNDEDQMIFDYMWENRDRLHEVSMRMALKIADLFKVSNTRWRTLADTTVLKRKAR